MLYTLLFDLSKLIKHPANTPQTIRKIPFFEEFARDRQ